MNNYEIPHPAPPERATITKRFLANLIDILILGAVGGCASFVLNLINFTAKTDLAQALWNSFTTVISIAIPAIYFIFFYSTTGQTFGKEVVKIKVISIDGSPLSLRKGILRFIGYLFSSLTFGIGYLIALFDKDKQAGHDKIASTLVVPAAVNPEAFKNTIDPAVVRRRQWGWGIGFGIPSILIIASYFVWIQVSTGEVRAMGPWPNREAGLNELIPLDLSALGLDPGLVENAPDQGSDGNYEEGASIEYYYGNRSVVTVWLLRYKDSMTAGRDFNGAVDWAKHPGNCGLYTYTTMFDTGVVSCRWSDGIDKIYRKGYWILDIVAFEGAPMQSTELVDAVRDAIAAHWQSLRQP